MTDSISPDDIPLKRCSSCPPDNQWHPATPEYFYRSKRDGLCSQCKVCMKAYQKERLSRPEVKEHKSLWAKEYSQRPEVQEHQHTYRQDYYSRSEVREHRHTLRKTYNSRPDIQKHRQTYGKEYQSRPTVHIHRQILSKNYHARPDIQARQQTYGKEYQSRPEIHEHRRAHDKSYRSRPEIQARDRIRVINRRARKKAVPGTHTSTQIAEQLKRQHYHCYYAACGHAKFEKRKGKYIYHIEHTYPLARVVGMGIPANDMSYIVLACPDCNQSKQDKFPWEWPEGGRLL